MFSEEAPPLIRSDWSGPLLAQAIAETPSVVLSFYSFGITLRKLTENGGCTEYAVDPEQVALALSMRMAFNTGLLNEDVLYMQTEGLQKTVVGYRRGQLTGLYLDGSDEPLRVPLPPLIMVRTVVGDETPRYQVYAVKQRPRTFSIPLFLAPLPNVYTTGGICWGSVQLRDGTSLQGADLTEDWQILLGTPFGSHAVQGKSSRHPDDIRELYLDLAARKTRVYPRQDLIPARRTLGQLLGEEAINES